MSESERGRTERDAKADLQSKASHCNCQSLTFAHHCSLAHSTQLGIHTVDVVQCIKQSKQSNQIESKTPNRIAFHHAFDSAQL